MPPNLNDPSTRTIPTEGGAILHPQRIGPYRILQVIGEGGMGIVYDAEQVEPVQRRVALKMMKTGMDTKEVVARFEAERQALAVMDHPGIARVLDAGATENGRPYFVMEHVRGIPLDEYCDLHKLGTTERLELFILICEAVQHAHHKGVIHRDLKPSNVLVAELDSKPVPKVIDFGIAKAISQRLTQKTLVTAYGMAMGTPAYMSPEQAEMSGLDVDTRTDIYSLGIMLYESLVGELPVDPEERGLQGFIAQLVSRETDAPSPSSKVGASGKAQHIAALRSTNPGGLQKELRGDLDWIVLKAMDSDRTRRYETANALAQEIERHKRHEPILARPPSAVYRVRKFVLRHRVGASVSALALFALVVFGVSMAVMNGRVARERDRAERETQKALAVNEFMGEVLTAAEPVGGLGPEATILAALDWIVAEHDGGFSDDPEVDASVQYAVANVYARIGRTDDAESLIQRSYEIRVAELGPDHPDVAESLYEMAKIQETRGNLDSAAVLLDRSLTIRRAALGPVNVRLASTLQSLGWVKLLQSDIDAAEPLLVEALQMLRAQEENPITASETLVALGELYRQRNELEQAERYMREALEVRARFYSPDHVKIGESLTNLAVVLDDMGEKEEAAALHRRSIEILESVFGAESDQVSAVLGNLGLVLTDLGEAEEGEVVHRRALEITTATAGENSFDAAIQHNNLAYHLCLFDKAREGITHSEIAVRIGDEVFEEGFFAIGVFRSTQGFCLGVLGRYATAEEVLLEATAIIAEALGSDHTHSVLVRDRLADVYDAWGKPDEAREVRARSQAER